MFESLLIKPQAILFKKETLNYVFSCECCETFKDSVFYRKPPVAASVHCMDMFYKC